MNKSPISTKVQPVTAPECNRLPVALRAAAAERKYADAVAMYASCDLSVRKIAELCQVPVDGLCKHISRNHRPLLFARYGLDCSMADSAKVRQRKGQTLKAYLKYKDAVAACADMAYIEYNVSQIARIFGLSAPALAAQLRVHYPDVITRREHQRQRLGLADNAQRGARMASKTAYAEAVEMYRTTDMTAGDVADRCDVSKSGLVQYMRFYQKDALEAKAERRLEASCRRKTAEKQDRPRQLKSSAQKYAAAIERLRRSASPVAEVAAEFGLNADVFRQYLKAHCPELAASAGMVRQPDGRLVKKSSSDKYAPAISEYASSADSLKDIARRHGLVYNSLLAFVKRNCPDECRHHSEAVARRLNQSQNPVHPIS